MQEIECTRMESFFGECWTCSAAAACPGTAGLPSVGFLGTDTKSLGSDVTLDEGDCEPNDEISVPSPTATREFWFGYLQLIRPQSLGSVFVVSLCAF